MNTLLITVTGVFIIRFIYSFFDSLYFYKATKRKSGHKGYIYFITEAGFILPVVKIGYAVELQQRLNTFRTGTPFFVWVFGTLYVSNMRYVESGLHRRYRHLRIRSNGEWFWLSPFILFDLFWLMVFWRIGA